LPTGYEQKTTKDVTHFVCFS